MRRALAAAVLVLAACGGDRRDEQDASGRNTRIPDLEGVVSAADATSVVIDGRRYRLTEDVASVSTYTLDAVPVRLDTFVHAGLDDDTGRVRWIATIGLVSDTEPPRVRYTGRLVSVIDGRAVFVDGTALLVPDDLRLTPGYYAVEVDPVSDRIVTASAP